MKKTHSRSNSIIYLIERTLRQTRMLLQHAFDESKLKISVDQWIVLSQISQGEGQNQRHIADMTAKDPASITRILELLEKQKLVKRIADKADKRSSLVAVTPAGKKMLSNCAKKVERFKKVAGKGISSTDFNELKETLDKLYENSGGKLS
jgi:MarR family transcriptional regulator for hemolysin